MDKIYNRHTGEVICESKSVDEIVELSESIRKDFETSREKGIDVTLPAKFFEEEKGNG